VADLNGDSIPDLVSSGFAAPDYVAPALMTGLGNGDGTFQAKTTTLPNTFYWAFTDDVVVGDFNGDSIPDAAAVVVLNANNSTTFVAIFLGRGDGTFQAPVFPINNANFVPVSLIAADLNGDHKLDLVATSSQSVVAWLNNGDGTFSAKPIPLPAPWNVIGTAVSDFNGDSKPDLVLSISSAGGAGMQIALGNGDGTFRAGSYYAANFLYPFYAYGPPLAIDFDGDQKIDLLLPSSTLNEFMVWKGRGDGTFTRGAAVFTGVATGGTDYDIPRIRTAVDFNGDSKPDLVFDGPPAPYLLLNTTP
jgi:hypothetical protein